MEKCLSETIAETLEADLASGRWKTGERLPSVDELRERFGAGEYAVRRAIRRLADSGAISVKKHVGAVFAAGEGKLSTATIDITSLTSGVKYFKVQAAQ